MMPGKDDISLTKYSPLKQAMDRFVTVTMMSVSAFYYVQTLKTFSALSISTDGGRKASAISLRKVGYFLP